MQSKDKNSYFLFNLYTVKGKNIDLLMQFIQNKKQKAMDKEIFFGVPAKSKALTSNENKI